MKVLIFALGFLAGVMSQNEQVAQKAFELGETTRCAVLDCEAL